VSGSIVEEDKGPRRWWHRVEEGLLITVLAAMVILPVGAVLIRWIFGIGLAGANLWVQALNLWIAFIGGALAARTNQHLNLSTGAIFGVEGKAKEAIAAFTSAVATAVTAYLAYASITLVIAESESSITLWGGVPMWWMVCAMPIGFVFMAVRFAWRGNTTNAGRAAAVIAVVAASLLAFVPPGERDWVVWAAGGTMLVAVALGAPLFTVMGGMAMLLFYASPTPIALSAVPSETMRLIADPSLAALPMFTFAGYLLAEGGSTKRLVTLFNAWFGWLPGGVAAAAVFVCAFFTTFTGASGVTILALGGLLLPALVEAGYDRKFAIGLICASGSIGLLFPPSLPVILYGVSSNVPITDLFIAGVLPGTLLVLIVVGYAVLVGVRQHGFAYYLPQPGPDGKKPDMGELVQKRVKFMVTALWDAKWEFALPVFVVVGIFGGYVTLFEAAAFTGAYALFIQTVVHKDLTMTEGVPKVVLETSALMGGVLVILGVALGLTSYLVDAEVPLVVRDAIQGTVETRGGFLLLLNGVLLIVGCLMDIYSAIVVVVPLIIPVAEVYEVHPVHLGIVFLSNLELGYLTPPVGLNLFLASFRFKEPLTNVWRYALPFLGLMTVGVLVITYVPAITMWSFEDTTFEKQPDFFEGLDEEAAPTPAPAALTPEQMELLLDDDPTNDPVVAPTPAPAPLTPEQMELLLDDDPTNDPVVAPTPAPAAPQTPPGGLDMDDIMKELEGE